MTSLIIPLVNHHFEFSEKVTEVIKHQGSLDTKGAWDQIFGTFQIEFTIFVPSQLDFLK